MRNRKFSCSLIAMLVTFFSMVDLPILSSLTESLYRPWERTKNRGTTASALPENTQVYIQSYLAKIDIHHIPHTHAVKPAMKQAMTNFDLKQAFDCSQGSTLFHSTWNTMVRKWVVQAIATVVHTSFSRRYSRTGWAIQGPIGRDWKGEQLWNSGNVGCTGSSLVVAYDHKKRTFQRSAVKELFTYVHM